MTNFLANGTEANISLSTLSTRNNTTELFVFLFLKGTRKIMLLPPATKLGQGYIFTGVCDSVHGGGGCSRGCLVRGPAPGGRGVCSCGGSAPRGVPGPRGGAWWRPPGTATAAGGTHPTGMHSCLIKF